VVDCDPQRSALTWSEVAAERHHEAPTVVAMASGLSKPGQLPELASGYHAVVLDCPPRRDDLVREVLMLATMALLPCGPGPTDVWALAESVDLVQKAQAIRPTLKAAIIITRKQPRTAIGRGTREALSAIGLPVLQTEVSYRVTWQESLAAGLAPSTYEPKSPAAEEVRALASEIERMVRRG
jgi:chromosome partitioning protein